MTTEPDLGARLSCPVSRDPRPESRSASRVLREMLALVDRVRLREAIEDALAGTFAVLAAAVSVTAVAPSPETVLSSLPPAGVYLAAGTVAVFGILRALRGRATRLEAAAWIEARVPSLRDSLVSAVEEGPFAEVSAARAAACLRPARMGARERPANATTNSTTEVTETTENGGEDAGAADGKTGGPFSVSSVVKTAFADPRNRVAIVFPPLAREAKRARMLLAAASVAVVALALAVRAAPPRAPSGEPAASALRAAPDAPNAPQAALPAADRQVPREFRPRDPEAPSGPEIEVISRRAAPGAAPGTSEVLLHAPPGFERAVEIFSSDAEGQVP